MDDYLVKPVRLEALRRALGECDPGSARSAALVAGEAHREAIDRAVLDGLREDLGDLHTLRHVLTAFVDRAPDVLARLNDAAARGDREAVAAAAHRLKGTSATLGALAVSELSAELERVAKDSSTGDLSAWLAAIDAEVARANRALRAEIAGIAV